MPRAESTDRLRADATRIAGEEIARSAVCVVRICDATTRRTRGEFILAIGVASLMSQRMTLRRMTGHAVDAALRHHRATRTARTAGAIARTAGTTRATSHRTAAGIAAASHRVAGHAAIGATSAATATTAATTTAAAVAARAFVAIAAVAAATPAEESLAATATATRGQQRDGKQKE